jgi:MFS family permease
MGMLSDAFGRRAILCGCMFAMTLPNALLPFSQDLPTLIGILLQHDLG